MARIIKAAMGYAAIPAGFPILVSERMAIIEPAFAWLADSDRCRPGFRDDLAHHSDLKSPTRSEMMSPTIPG